MKKNKEQKLKQSIVCTIERRTRWCGSYSDRIKTLSNSMNIPDFHLGAGKWAKISNLASLVNFPTTSKTSSWQSHLHRRVWNKFLNMEREEERINGGWKRGMGVGYTEKYSMTCFSLWGGKYFSRKFSVSYKTISVWRMTAFSECIQNTIAYSEHYIRKLSPFSSSIRRTNLGGAKLVRQIM